MIDGAELVVGRGLGHEAGQVGPGRHIAGGTGHLEGADVRHQDAGGVLAVERPAGHQLVVHRQEFQVLLERLAGVQRGAGLLVGQGVHADGVVHVLEARGDGQLVGGPQLQVDERLHLIPAGVLVVFLVLRHDDAVCGGAGLLAVVGDGAAAGGVVVVAEPVGVGVLHPEAGAEVAEAEVPVHVGDVAVDLVLVQLDVAGDVAVRDGLGARRRGPAQARAGRDVGGGQGRVDRRFRIVLVIVDVGLGLELQGRGQVAVQLGVVEEGVLRHHVIAVVGR